MLLAVHVVWLCGSLKIKNGLCTTIDAKSSTTFMETHMLLTVLDSMFRYLTTLFKRVGRACSREVLSPKSQVT